MKRSKELTSWTAFTAALIILSAGIFNLVLVRDVSGASDENTVNRYIVMETNFGDVAFELFETKAPITTQNFLKYVNDGFYNGLAFHRIANLDSTSPSSRIIQGGGFLPDGTNVPATYDPIPLETNPEATHVDGAVAMARTSDPNSATSQFYFCWGPHHFLDHSESRDGYAVFGLVSHGMSTLENLSKLPVGTKNTPYGPFQDWPLTDAVIQNVNWGDLSYVKGVMGPNATVNPEWLSLHPEEPTPWYIQSFGGGVKDMRPSEMKENDTSLPSGNASTSENEVDLGEEANSTYYDPLRNVNKTDAGEVVIEGGGGGENESPGMELPSAVGVIMVTALFAAFRKRVFQDP